MGGCPMAYSRRRTTPGGAAITNGSLGVGSYGDGGAAWGGWDMGMMGADAWGTGKGAGKGMGPSAAAWKPDYGGRGAVLEEVNMWREFAKSWVNDGGKKKKNGGNNYNGGGFCKWCEKGECWDHGQISKPACEGNDDSEPPAK